VIILKDELDVLLGNVFLSAASVAYYGPFTGTFRDMIVADWIEKIKELEIPYAENYSLQNILGNPI
jgi:dynein heavy chain